MHIKYMHVLISSSFLMLSLTQCPSSVAGRTDPVETGVVVPLNNSDITPTPCHHNITITDNTSNGNNSK